MKKDLFIEVVCAFLILLFSYALLSKLIGFTKFYYQLKTSPIIGNYATIVAVALFVAEFSIICLLLFNKTRLQGFILAFFVLILFTSYITYGLWIEKKLPCSCGGVLESLTWVQHIWFNSGFIMLCALGIWKLKSGRLITYNI